MTKPNDIPQDVWGAALKCAETVCRNLDYPNVTAEVTAIARAIMAAKEEEREECAKIADIYAEAALMFETEMRNRKLANNTNKD